MPVTALTIDFWNTMVNARANGERRRLIRSEHLTRLVSTYRAGVTAAQIQSAIDDIAARFDLVWRTEHRTPNADELLRQLWDILDVVPSDDKHEGAVSVFEESLLAAPPSFAAGLVDALEWASERYRLAVISDTMFSPGRVIRRLLAINGLLDYFQGFVFSDETGFSKPDVRAYEAASRAIGTVPSQTVHIGDLHMTDIRGIRLAGGKGILFTGLNADCEPADTSIRPHARLADWRDLETVLNQLV